jgi:hypothetical protein
MKFFCQFFEGFETLKHMWEEMNSDKVLPKWKPNGWKVDQGSLKMKVTREWVVEAHF